MPRRRNRSALLAFQKLRASQALGVLVIVGASNAVNLTDGLDGLAIGVTITTCGAFAVIAYFVGRVDFSRELYLFYVPEAGELSVIAAALFGGSLGVLGFNS